MSVSCHVKGERELEIMEKGVLRKAYGPEREEVTGDRIMRSCMTVLLPNIVRC
jgi:hypothetical protein